MIIQDGTGSGYTAGVDSAKRLQVSSRQNNRSYYQAVGGNNYTITAADAGPVAAEYTLYFKNDSDTYNFIVSRIDTYATDADVVWKLAKVTGTAATAAAITPVQTNTGSGKSALTTCRGGAGGVTGLTPSAVIWQWYNGVANTTRQMDTSDTLIVAPGQAIALEYDAGTGGAVLINMIGFYDVK